TVAKSNQSARGGRHTLAWHQNARQIERVGSAHGDGLTRGREVAQRPKGFHRHRQSELFPEKATDESSAADFSAILEPPQSDQQFAPSGKQGLAREHVAKDDAVAAQEHPANRFQSSRAIHWFAGVQERPAPRAVPGTRAPPPPPSGAALGIDKGPEIVKAIRSQHRSEEHTSELQSLAYLVCRLL